jgi:hypothetical protein
VLGARVLRSMMLPACFTAYVGACLGACRSRDRERSVAPIQSSELRDATPTSSPRGLLQRFPLRLHTTWTDRREALGRTTRDTAEERWIPVAPDTWDVVMVERRGPDGGAPALATRFVIRPEGIVAIGTRFESTYDPYDVPQLWLPADARLDRSWKEQHAPPAEPRERACRIDENPACADGVAVTCTRTFSSGEVTVQTHLFCDGIGWTGYSLTTTDVDGKTIVERRFGEDVRDLTP